MPTHIADKSALSHLSKPVVDAKLTPLVMAGRLATCGVIELEVLYSARSITELVATREERSTAFPRVPMTEDDFSRAEDVMVELARTGRHRAVSLPDLLIAAIAERERLIVLHYDRDFDIIASVTGQPVEWVAPRGSL